MAVQSVSGSSVRAPSPPVATVGRKLRSLGLALGAGILTRLLGAADGRTVVAMAHRELTLILRSRGWHRCVGMWLLLCAGIIALPILFRSDTGRWLSPSGPQWMMICGYALQILFAATMAQWSIHRVRRDLYTHRLDELMLTRCSPADVAMGEALASATASLWLVAAAFPVCLFLAALAGQDPLAGLKLALSLAPAGGLGVWFGMGWGLAFTLRRSGAIVPLTQWWFMGPFIPIFIAWSALGCYSFALAFLGALPGGSKALGAAVAFFGWVARQIISHWNPLLVMAAAAEVAASTWFTDWLALLFVLLFMMRKSMDAIQLALAAMPDQDSPKTDASVWVHHDVHYFTQYGEGGRRQPQYRDGGNPIAAFDVALGHRVFLHPFFWALAIMLYLFMLGWSLLIPAKGLVTALVAVLLPATGALLLMSGGVAVSFGWERDQHRWPSLAVLPVDNLRLALGKIKGVVRPTLWIGFTSSLTAVLLGWRGALPLEPALWMAIHVLIFPVALACVSAVLALSTPNVSESLYRWAVLGAIPALATALPPPVGGDSGIALPFSPPLLVLILVLTGPTPGLIRGAWVSLGLEVFGIIASLLILTFLLRRWTVGEKD